MSGRDEGYYGPSIADMDRGCAAVFGIALVAALALGLCCCAGGDGPAGGDAAETDAGSAFAASSLAIDVDDSWAMHDADLPTKADVLAWHMYGRWAFYRTVDGVQEVHIFEDLPGGARVWDALYGLDPENPAFKFTD